MPALDLLQTDDSQQCGSGTHCSSRTATAGAQATSTMSYRAGTAGTAAKSVTINAAETNVVGATFTIFSWGSLTRGLNRRGLLRWAAGDHVVRLNITTAIGNITLEEVHACRLNNSCVSQESLGSVTGLAQVVSSTGVITATISGASAVASPAVDDRLAYIFVFSNDHSHANRTFQYTPDQVCNTPFELGDERKVRIVC